MWFGMGYDLLVVDSVGMDISLKDFFFCLDVVWFWRLQ